MTKSFTLLTVLLSTLLISLTSNATIISGYGAYTSASNCSPDCGGLFEYDQDGGEHSTFAMSEEYSYANSKALADLSGSSYLPILKVMASANSGKTASAFAFAMQGFTYSGAETTTITLNMNLHGSVNSNDSGYNRLRADVGILAGNVEWYAHFGTSYFEVNNGIEMKSLSISDGVNVNMPGFLSFDVNPGDLFFVMSSMSANAQNGYADAWNTLTMNFQDSTGLQAITAPANESTATDVPEPSTLILVMFALAIMVRRSFS